MRTGHKHKSWTRWGTNHNYKTQSRDQLTAKTYTLLTEDVNKVQRKQEQGAGREHEDKRSSQQ